MKFWLKHFKNINKDKGNPCSSIFLLISLYDVFVPTQSDNGVASVSRA